MQVQVKTKRCLNKECLQIQQNAEQGICNLIPKHHVSKVVKGLCASRMRGSAFGILDIIFGDLQEEDCQLNTRAICYRSNKSFAIRLNIDESTVQRALKNLALYGFLTFKDSPTGKRYFCKKTNQKYGIDLTPSWNNYAAFKEELDALRRHKAIQQRLKAAVKTSRKTQLLIVEKLLEEARQAGAVESVRLLEQLKVQIEKINNAAMGYSERLDSLEIIAGKLEEISDQIRPEMVPVPAPTRWSTRVNAVHQYNTSLIPLNKFCNQALEEKRNLKPCLNAKFYIGEIVTSDFSTCHNRIIEFDRSVTSVKTEKLLRPFVEAVRGDHGLTGICFETMRQALPEVIEAYGFEWRDWRDVTDSIFALKRGLGLSDDALRKGLELQGCAYVAVCLAVILEMVLRDREVSNPGGYVRWLLRRFHDGEQILEQLLFDLMEAETACH